VLQDVAPAAPCSTFFHLNSSTPNHALPGNHPIPSVFPHSARSPPVWVSNPIKTASEKIERSDVPAKENP
jgi:hypothetical protein